MSHLLFGIRCSVIEQTTFSSSLKWDEASCLRYLEDLDSFLRCQQQQIHHHPNSLQQNHNYVYSSTTVHLKNFKKLEQSNILFIGYKDWVEFSSNHYIGTPFTLLDIAALWSLIAATAVSEEFAIYKEDIEKNNPYLNNLPSLKTNSSFCVNEENYYPLNIVIDFRHFGILLFFQIRRCATAARLQLYHRLLRASNEVGYPNPAAAAAAYRHAAQATGGLVSPRSDTKPSSTLYGATQTFLSATVAGAASPRDGNHSSMSTVRHGGSFYPLLTIADELKEFISSKLNSLLKIILREYSTPIHHVSHEALNVLSILLEPPQNMSISKTLVSRRSSLSSSTDFPVSLIQEVFDSGLYVSSSEYPILCRSTPSSSPTCFNNLSSTLSTGLNGSDSISSESVQLESLGKEKVPLQDTSKSTGSSMSVSASSLTKGKTITIEGQRRDTIFQYDDDNDSIENLQIMKKDVPVSSNHRSQHRLRHSQSDVGHSIKKKRNLVCDTAYLADLIDCHIYLLKKIKHIKIQTCKDTRIFLPAVSGVVSVIGCTNVELIATGRSFKIENCYETKLHIYSLTRPILCGDTRGTILGPYNGIFSKQHQFMNDINIKFAKSFVSIWAYPILLGAPSVTTHHPMGHLSTNSTIVSPGGHYIGTSSTTTSIGDDAIKDGTHPSKATSMETCIPNSTEFCHESSIDVSVSLLKPPVSLSCDVQSSNEMPLHTPNVILNESNISHINKHNELNLGIFSLVAPDKFRTFIIPERHSYQSHNNEDEVQNKTTNEKDHDTSETLFKVSNLYLPEIYCQAFQIHQKKVIGTLQKISQLCLNESPNKKHHISASLHHHFLTWIQQSGVVRELIDLSKIDVTNVSKGTQTIHDPPTKAVTTSKSHLKNSLRLAEEITQSPRTQHEQN